MSYFWNPADEPGIAASLASTAQTIDQIEAFLASTPDLDAGQRGYWDRELAAAKRDHAEMAAALGAPVGPTAPQAPEAPDDPAEVLAALDASIATAEAALGDARRRRRPRELQQQWAQLLDEARSQRDHIASGMSAVTGAAASPPPPTPAPPVDEPPDYELPEPIVNLMDLLYPSAEEFREMDRRELEQWRVFLATTVTEAAPHVSAAAMTARTTGDDELDDLVETWVSAIAGAQLALSEIEGIHATRPVERGEAPPLRWRRVKLVMTDKYGNRVPIKGLVYGVWAVHRQLGKKVGAKPTRRWMISHQPTWRTLTGGGLDTQGEAKELVEAIVETHPAYGSVVFMDDFRALLREAPIQSLVDSYLRGSR
jgi:hypothetical protein